MGVVKLFDGRQRASDGLRRDAREVLKAPQDKQNELVFKLAIMCDMEGVNVLKLLEETRKELA